jgi:hypothetical protein
MTEKPKARKKKEAENDLKEGQSELSQSQSPSSQREGETVDQPKINTTSSPKSEKSILKPSNEDLMSNKQINEKDGATTNKRKSSDELKSSPGLKKAAIESKKEEQDLTTTPGGSPKKTTAESSGTPKVFNYLQDICLLCIFEAAK